MGVDSTGASRFDVLLLSPGFLVPELPTVLNLWQQLVNPFNIVAATPFKRDPLRELAEECRKQGMKLGFYYSQDQDWTFPGGSAYKTGNHDSATHHWDPAAQDGDFDTYLHTKAIPQMNVYWLGFPFQIMLSFLLIGASVTVLPGYVNNLVNAGVHDGAVLLAGT